jgi:hypothetical protein
MRTRLRLTVLLLTAAMALAGCVGVDVPQNGSGTRIGDEPLGDDEVLLHLAQEPVLPDVLADATVTLSELRTENLTERHIVQLVDLPATVTSLEAPLEPGAVLLVSASQTLQMAVPVDVAVLAQSPGAGAPGVLGGLLLPCAAPCTVTGPALVARAGWFAGYAMATGWQLLVPADLE